MGGNARQHDVYSEEWMWFTASAVSLEVDGEDGLLLGSD